MSKVIARKKRVNRNVEIGAVHRKATGMVEDLDARIEAIQWLVPLGLEAVAEELHRAVEELAGRRYQRKGSHQPFRRWGCQPGSVFLGDQKVPIDVPRVRNVDSDTEVSLAAYQALRTPRKMDEGLLRRVLERPGHSQLRGLCRDRAGGVRPVPFVGFPSLRERHHAQAAPIPGAISGGLRPGGPVSRRQELCG